MDKIKIAVIGCGARGSFLLSTLLRMDDVIVTGVCDVYDDRTEDARKAAAVKNPDVLASVDYRDILAAKPDGCIIATSWAVHIQIACDAMNAGVVPALECGGSASVTESWKLVRTAEETGMRCMFLENCNFGHEEMTILNMIKMGMFGDIVYCAGAYQHDCRALLAEREARRMDRMNTYFHKNAEIYPSHELGPIMKYLDINHGNRIVSIVSASSKAIGQKQFSGEKTMQGDIVTTMMTTANGQAISIAYETTLPRPYSRAGRVDGTKGCWLADCNGIYLNGINESESFDSFSKYLEDERYEHPLWREYRTSGIESNGGHGGMDWLVLREFVESIRDDREPLLNVYDAALLTAITPLSEESLLTGKVVAVPDFTDGKWILE